MSTDYVGYPWRTGRKVGRTLYAQLGPEPTDTDPLIGVMDTAELAREAVHSHNGQFAPTGDTPRSEAEDREGLANAWRNGAEWQRRASREIELQVARGSAEIKAEALREAADSFAFYPDPTVRQRLHHAADELDPLAPMQPAGDRPVVRDRDGNVWWRPDATDMWHGAFHGSTNWLHWDNLIALHGPVTVLSEGWTGATGDADA